MQFINSLKIMKKKYPPKIGFIKFILPFFVLVLCIVGFAWGLFDQWYLYGNLIFMALIPLSNSPVHYTINDTTFIIKYALFAKIKIDINNIIKIKETNSLFSVPALAFSLDRIEISYYNDKYREYDSITISPKNKYEFIQDLMSINSDIVVIYKEIKNTEYF